MDSKKDFKKLMLVVDEISTFVGKGSGWLIILLMVMVCIDVFRRYVLNAPSAWIGELSVMCYGAVIMLSGAYTLAQNGHVRGDFLYGSMKPRTQATFDLILYIVFFLPGVTALCYAGYTFAADSWRIGEHTTQIANGPPVYHFKSLIPIAGAFLLLQGFIEIIRCVICLNTGEWPERLKDAEEIDVVEQQLQASTYVDEESKNMAIASAKTIDEMAHQRIGGMKGEKIMSDPYYGLLMLCLIVVVIMLGFPTAFTLMGLGMAFGFFAFYDPSDVWTNNKIFTLMVQRTYGGMTNDTLLSIPLFVLMGYVMERGALVDKMFHSVQLAFRGMPASLAVATLVICTFWGIASGLVGAVVVLMGVIALKPMLNAGYDVRLASGVITAGGTLGILIPPSVMIIVYAAVAGQSVVKLYAAAMLPGFFLALLYLVYVIGWALIDPKIAPKLPPEMLKVPIPASVAFLRDHYSTNFLVATIKAAFAPSSLLNAPEGTRITYGRVIKNLISALFPLLMTTALIAGTWWYVVIHPKALFDEAQAVLVIAKPLPGPTASAPPKAQEETLVEIGADSSSSSRSSSNSGGGLIALDADPDNADSQKPDVYTPPSSNFYLYFGIASFLTVLLLLNYYRKLRDEQFEILKLLVESVMPLGILTVVVLAVILLGITTATESAAIGAAGAFLLAWSSGSFTFERMKQAVFLTTKTTSMVCWLFVGSALFSAVFAILGGQQIIESWVLGMNLSPLQFMLLSQALIFVLGWPLEWTEIIVIFVPIFLPMLSHFNIDPILWGTLVFVNLQAAFLSPPVAMSAFYLKGVAPPHVTLNQIFAGMMPYMFIVIICMAIMYAWPGMTLWLPKYLYGGG